MLCANAQFYGGKSDIGTGATGLRLILSATTCVAYYDSTLIFYKGGNFAGAGTNLINSVTCPITIDSVNSFYKGGIGAGSTNNIILPSICATTIDTTVVFYHGGSASGAASNIILPSICQVTLDSTVIFYHGGNFGSNASAGIISSTCAVPAPNNIYMGGNSTTSAPGNLLPTTSNNTAGAFITSIDGVTITNGNCVTLTTTGLNATAYSWAPIIGLNNPNIQSPIASPSTTTTYTVTASGTAGCRNVYEVTINVASGNESGTTIRYPTAIISKTVTTPQTVILTGITGGVFSPSSSNLKISALTGEITPNTSTAGTYTINYTYGTCSNVISTSVIITTDPPTNGEVIYPNFYLGAGATITAPSILVTQSSCSVPSDFTLMIFAGGTGGAAVPRILLTGGACTPSIDYSVSFFKGGTSAGMVTAPNKLMQGPCTPYINPSNTIYMGGTSSINTAMKPLISAYCNYPVGDNFYMGGSGTGYGNGSLTPTTGASTGTTVVTLSDFTICPGVSSTLTTTGATNYTWTPATGLSSTTIASPIARPLSTTTYTVTGTGGVGCFNTAKVTVTVLTDGLTNVSYGAFRFNENDLALKKVNFIIGPLTGTFSTTPATGLLINEQNGSFTPGLSTPGLYTINYNYTKAGCNYTYPVNINITTLPPTIIYPNPTNFYLNFSGITITPTVTDATPVGFELLNPLPAGLTMNTTTGVISGTPSELVNNAKVGIRAYNYTKLLTNNYSDTYTLTVNVRQPIINSTTTDIYALSTTYGTASNANTINVSGQYIYQNIVVTPSNGFEVSRDNVTFANTVSLSQSGGTITNTNVYVRLGSNARVGNYTGTIVLSSSAANNITIPIALSSVAAAPLTITASYFQKFYGSKLVLGTGNANFTSNGLFNNEVIGSVTLTADGGTGAEDNPGMYAITPTNATGGTFSPTNYNITYVPGQFEVLYSLYGFTMNGNASNWVKGKVPIPKIAAGVISNITSISATYDGSISSAFSKFTLKGVCWNTIINPTISNSAGYDTSPNTGPMTVYMTGLSGGSTYYARTFVKIGNFIYYGPNVKFTLPY
jgi:hypothetical protein